MFTFLSDIYVHEQKNLYYNYEIKLKLVTDHFEININYLINYF